MHFGSRVTPEFKAHFVRTEDSDAFELDLTEYGDGIFKAFGCE